MNPLPVGPGLNLPHRWVRAHPRVVDSLIAVGTFASILISAVTNPHERDHSIDPVFVILAAVGAGSLMLRRRLPRVVLAVTCAAAVIETVFADSGPRPSIGAAAVVALFSLAANTDRHTTWRLGALTVVLLTGAVMIFGIRPWYTQDNVAVFAWTGLAAAAGDAVRSRRAFITAIEERAVRAEQSREEEARRRVAEERLRIARELHDVVAHHIALVNVQAGVASHVMDNRPDQAKQALAHVREASRSALDELRATVGLLRQHGDPAAPTEPAPGLGVLDQLVDGFVRAGLHVEVERAPQEEGLGPLTASVDLTAYRVVQEALTNVQKHAGADARAAVRIVRTRGALEITVLDDGRPEDASAGREPSAGRDPQEAAPPGAGGGHGLIGMRERISALRGECEAGPLPDGGFRVRARLPLQVRSGGDG